LWVWLNRKIGRRCNLNERNQKYISNFDSETSTKEPAWQTRGRWERNIEMDLRGSGCIFVHWI
jgi:hypothetical protein